MPSTTVRNQVGKWLRTDSAAAKRLARGLPSPVREALRRPWPRTPANVPFPVPSAGEVLGPPDFVGVGVQQAGSTWWYCLVAAHPEVHDPPGRPTEIHYFDSWWAGSPGSATDYDRYFPRPSGKIVGEWTPRYLFDYWVAPLLAEAAPQAKILVLLRDPVERYASGLAHEFAHRAPRHATVATDAAQRGLYAHQLRRLFDAVDRDRVLIEQYERCLNDRTAALRRTYEFLGVEPGFAPETSPCQHRLEETVDAPLDPAVRDRLRAFYHSDVVDLTELVPEIDLTIWPNFAGATG
jgi:hypothetical protein